MSRLVGPAPGLRIPVLLVLCALACGCGQEPASTGPNIILILTDDHRHDAMGCAGDVRLETPRMDRLAAEGLRFTNAFVTTSLCSPSRASILTGTYAHIHGVIANEYRDPDPSLPMFPELLQEAGYETAFIGKWHMLRDARARPGFDHWVSFVGQGEYRRNTLNVDGRWELSTAYLTDELTDRALAFIERERKSPFFLYLSHKAAHAPFEPDHRHRDRYAGVRFEGGDNPEDRLDLKPDWGGRRTGWDPTAELADYHRCLLAVDEGLGRILDALAAQGILDDTVIVYAGDNGYLFGEHGGLLDKRTAYEPSLRIPLLVRYPRLAGPGTTNENLALNIDLAPTLLALAGVPAPGTTQGRNLFAPAEDGGGREAFLYEYFAGEGAIPTILAARTADLKYVTYPLAADLPAELYDLGRDPGELHNRIDDPDYRDRLGAMQQLLERLKTETEFRLPTGEIDRS